MIDYLFHCSRHRGSYSVINYFKGYVCYYNAQNEVTFILIEGEVEERQVILRKKRDGLGMHLSAGPPPVYVEFTDRGLKKQYIAQTELFILF